jgi:predicted dehydrogenase
MLRLDRSEESTHDNYDWLTLDLVHCLDLARWVPGSEMVNFHLTKRAFPVEQKVNSEFHSMATFKNGVTSFFSSNVRVGHRILQFELHGVGISIFMTSEPNDGTVPEDKGTSHHDMVATIYTSDGSDPYASLPVPEIIHSYQVAPENTQQAIAGFYDQDRHFIDCSKAGKSTECSLEDACQTIELCNRFLEGL